MGTPLNRLTEAVLTSTHNLCFEQKYEEYQNFLPENFRVLVVKFSVYLNRHVFVMQVDHFSEGDQCAGKPAYKYSLLHSFKFRAVRREL